MLLGLLAVTLAAAPDPTFAISGNLGFPYMAHLDARYWWSPTWRVAARQLEIRPAPGTQRLSESYWGGAALSHPSRESSLTNAFALADALSVANSVPTAAQLAGLLAHACPPPEAGRVTLDGLRV